MEHNKLGLWKDALASMKGNLLTKHTEHKFGVGQPAQDGEGSPHVTAITGHPKHVASALHAHANAGQGEADPGELPTQGEGSDDMGDVEGAEGSFHEGPGNSPETDPASRMVSHMQKARKK